MGLNNANLAVMLRHKNIKTTDYNTLPDEINLALSQDFAAGVAAEQCDQVFGPDKRTLAGGTAESLDLVGGGLLDNFGNAIALVKVRVIVIQNLSATKILTVGNDANPLLFLGGPTETYPIPPKGKMALDNPVTGWTVTPGTGDKIKVANNAGDPADYLVWILGTSS